MAGGVVIIADLRGKGYGFAKGVYDYVKERLWEESSVGESLSSLFDDEKI